MIYTIENDLLKVSVTTEGAQLCSVIRKCDGTEHIWQADESVWRFQAPVMFPYCGKLNNGKMEAKGKIYETNQHGFARTTTHTFVRQSDTEIVLELTDSPETLAQWPYHFRLESRFILNGDQLTHRLTVENRDDELMRFGIGYHPGFAIPFDDQHTASDYELRFDRIQSPMCLDCLPHGLINGKWYYLARNIDTIALDEKLFANDSHCMFGLTAKTLGLYEKGTGRGVECDISGFPYCLIWSKPEWPMPFVCIEPWMSLPASEDAPLAWNAQAAAAELTPGESWHVEMKTRYVR